MQTQLAKSSGCIPLAVALWLLGLAGCASFPPASFPEQAGAPAPAGASPTAHGRHAVALEDAARRAEPEARPALQLQAARAWLRAGRSGEATRVLAALTAPLTPAQLTEQRVLEADIELASGRAQRAWQMISAIGEPTGTLLAPQYLDSRMRIALAAGRPVEGVRAELAAERLATTDAERSALRSALLAQLRAAREHGVKLDPEASVEPIVRGWLELGAIASAGGGASLDSAAAAVRWRARYPGHPATELLVTALAAPLPAATRLHKLALLLPVSGPAAGYAATIQAGFNYAWQQLPADSRPQLQLYDTGSTAVDQALRQARTDGNDFIVGPLTRQEVDIAASAWPGLPMLALNFLSEGRSAPLGMDQFALSPEDDAREVARRMLASGQKRGAVISPTGDWGTRVLAAFRQELLAGGGAIVAQAFYDPSDHDFTAPIRALIGTDQSYARRQRLQGVLGQKLEFEPRGRADLDFIFAPALAGAERLLRPQLRFQYADNVPVYATSDAFVDDGSPANQDLDGLIIPSMPWLVPNSGPAAALRAQLAASSGDDTAWRSGLYAFGYDAFQLATAIVAAGHDLGEVRIAGLTGELTLNPDGRVHREPVWARITRSGQPQLLGGIVGTAGGR